jgi:glycosyltransferase involved in cell wall biosynthesis
VTVPPVARALTLRSVDRLRVLIVTKVFPNQAEPQAAAFNRQKFAAMARLCHVDLLAVLQWFPGASWFPSYTTAGKVAGVPGFEWIDGLLVRHPRVLHLPAIDHAIAPALYVASLWPAVRALRGKIDVVLGSHGYPDGVAAVGLARLLGVPGAIYMLGSDLNVIPRIPGVARILRWTLPRTDRVLVVSRGLAERAVHFGGRPDRVELVPNGVDRSVFQPRDRAEARAAAGLPLDGRQILYVGRLVREKGVLDLLAAFELVAARAPDVRLVIGGDGPCQVACRAAAARWPGRIVLTGARPLAGVADLMAAADVVTLPSHAEGTPNVVLEALASGRRVVASAVGGIPDVLGEGTESVLIPPGDPRALASALAEALHAPGDPERIAARAPADWSRTAAQVVRSLSALVAPRPVEVEQVVPGRGARDARDL